jgi:DNA-binding NarL/FixJ family response regulator
MAEKNEAGNPVTKKLLDEALQGIDISGVAVPMEIFSRTLFGSIQTAHKNGREDEREENVCRLLASGMSAGEIAVVLSIREAEINLIEQNNAARIPEYAKKLKERRRRREKAGKP